MASDWGAVTYDRYGCTSRYTTHLRVEAGMSVSQRPLLLQVLEGEGGCRWKKCRRSMRPDMRGGGPLDTVSLTPRRAGDEP